MHGRYGVFAFPLACAVAFVALAPAAAQERTTPPRAADAPLPAVKAPALSIEKVSASCWVATRAMGAGNAGFIVGKDTVLVIDSLGDPRLAKQLLDKIKSVTKKPIRSVVQTHWHYDHTLGNQVFGDNVEIVMGAKAAAKFDSRLRADGMLLGPASGAHKSLNIRKVRPASETVKRQEKIDLGGLDVILSVVGECHSDEDLVVWVPSEKVLYCGDLVSNGHHPLLNGGSTFRTIDVLARLERLAVEHVVPGHGPRGKKALLATQRGYLAQLRGMVRHLGQRKMKPEEIVEKLEMPKSLRDLGHAAAWRDNVRFVVRELFTGR